MSSSTQNSQISSHYQSYRDSQAAPARPVFASPTPLHQQSQSSSYRHVPFEHGSSEKQRPEATGLSSLSNSQSIRASSYPSSRSFSYPSSSRPSSPLRRPTTRLSSPSAPSNMFASPHPSLHCDHTHARRLRLHSLLRPWLPLIMYICTSLGFLIAIAFWKEEVFQGLDDLSKWLQEDKSFGYCVLFILIFLTTFPPLPLYSTFIILSGYTFGPWTGAIISYWAALTGAVVVFLLSRYLLRDTISSWLSCATSIKRVVRAIEKRPKLLFLIRLAPYPYNVMNCLLGASHTLTMRTYLICTATSLFKVIIHTALGASIHSFADYHVKPRPDGSSDSVEFVEPEEESALAHYSTIAGVALCLGIFVYLSYVARKAVDEELEDDEVLPTHTDEEATAFLSPMGQAGRNASWEDLHEASGAEDASRASLMAEVPTRAGTPSILVGTRECSPFRGQSSSASLGGVGEA